MWNYKIIIQYEGSRYNGWQKQKNTKDTIQEKIEEVISKMTGESVEISASGRTDAGVHALSQVANFKIDKKLEKKEFLEYTNRYLPKDIRILEFEDEDMRFHARLNAKKKTYLYRIDNTDYGMVFERKYAMRFIDKLSVEDMRAAAKILVGEHDFKSFCTKQNMKKSTVRTIYDIEIKDKDGIIEIEYTGNGFLYNMVRIITGTLMEVGRGRISVNQIKDILDAKDRKRAGFTAEPEGLFLKKVYY